MHDANKPGFELGSKPARKRVSEIASYRVLTERIKGAICGCGCYELIKLAYALENKINDYCKEFWEKWQQGHPICGIHTKEEPECRCCDYDEDCRYCYAKPKRVPLEELAADYEDYFNLAHSLILPHLTHHLLLQYNHDKKLEELRKVKLGEMQPDPLQNLDDISLDTLDARSKHIDSVPFDDDRHRVNCLGMFPKKIYPTIVEKH